MTPKYGARTYRLGDDVVIVKQTRLGDGRYVVDTDQGGNHIERHIEPGPTQAVEVGRAVLEAHQGALTK
jgi:hypothetical protein